MKRLTITGLLLVAGLLAFVLYPGNPEPQPVFAAEITGTTAPAVTVRFVETQTTRYVDIPVPAVDAPVTVVARIEPVVAEENTTEFFFQQPDNAIVGGTRVMTLAMVGNEVYRAEPQADAGNETFPVEPQTEKVLLTTLLN
ncbi:MAG: hypothetical protein Q7J73_05860 [Dehalococcoidales bacterium]|nr:hypothetical protein [Dehalococcoidales bacterium]